MLSVFCPASATFTVLYNNLQCKGNWIPIVQEQCQNISGYYYNYGSQPWRFTHIMGSHPSTGYNFGFYDNPYCIKAYYGFGGGDTACLDDWTNGGSPRIKGRNYFTIDGKSGRFLSVEFDVNNQNKST